MVNVYKKNVLLNKMNSNKMFASSFAYLLIFLTLLLVSAPTVFAVATAVDLGASESFVVLTHAGITDSPTSIITGNIGTDGVGSSITGFSLPSTCPEVTGIVYTKDATGPACAVIDATLLNTAMLNVGTAYTNANGQATDVLNAGNGAGEIGGLTLTPGVYTFTGASINVLISTDLTLSGNSTDLWVFQIPGTFNIATDKKVNLIGGAQAKNIFWVVGDETTLFPGSTLEGTILDYAGIAMQSLATLNGRAFSSTASVTLIANTITYPTASIDTNIPIITLIGDSNINVDFNTIYVDLNATAMDDVDGNITSSIISVSDVNTLKLGSYDVNFNVTDSSGNSAVQVTRTVNVVDRNAPIFDLNVFNPTLTVINDTNAVVDINASEIVNCKYNLNEDVNYSLMTSSEQLIDLNGVINVSNLTGDTDYNLFVRCRDVSNNDSNNSKLFAFKTQLDINAPTFNRTVTLNDHNAIVTITLSELAKCRVSVNDINYASMDVNTTSDSFALTQTFTFTQLVPGTDYNKFFQCIDTSGIDSNKTDVNRYATIRTIDVNAPIVALSTSSTTTNSTIISVTTDEPSTCRYALTDVNYDLMTNDLNTTWDSLSVNWNISGLDSSTNYLYYVMCRDSNVNDSNASISFTTAQRSSGGGGGSIIPTCSSYVYSDWNACKADGTRVRSIVSSVPIRCIGNPILTQSCTYDVTDPTGGSTTPTCTSFVYSDWDVCGTDSEQSRTVVSSLPNNCVNGNTVLIQSCIPIPTAVIPNDTNTTDNLSVDKGLGDLGLIIVVIIILLVLGAGGLYYYFNVVKK